MEENRKSSTLKLYVALIIALGISSVGFFIRSGIVHFKDSERSVVVKGLCEREVQATRVIWPLMYKEVGNDISAIYDRLNATNEKIISFLTQNGLTEEEITISPAKVIDMEAREYQSSPVKYRYNVTQVIIVASSQVDKVRSLMNRQGDLLKEGIAIGATDYMYSTRFTYDALNDIKPEMIQCATENARAAAEKFAHDSQSRLGKIKRASQGQFSITDRDENTPYIKTVRVVTTIEYYLKD
ncbi:MAG: SIMPL domain-containing protein [Flavobacteriales bacterium]|nr:SIMPL domain-containing protein [Flavobacteriales bacterium]MBQ8650844.1 SIMPL domain-containing protein [Flavobacteriales bacterium]